MSVQLPKIILYGGPLSSLKSTSAGTGGEEVGSPACMSFAFSASFASSCRAAATAGSRACTLGMLPLAGRAAGASKNVSLGLLCGFSSLSLEAAVRRHPAST